MSYVDRRRETGRAGEAAAAAYLRREGYRVRATNYRCPLGELDLIAEDTQTRELVFVEVRTRGSHAFGLPEESITRTKSEKLMRLASHYLAEQPELRKSRDAGYRIDVVAVDLAPSGQVLRLEHYKHAVERR